MKNKLFPLSHLVLYAKGWYKRSPDIWEDLKEILKFDDYMPFTQRDIYDIIVHNFNNWENTQSDLNNVLIGIHPKECWRTGYYTKDAIWVKEHNSYPEYDMPTAFLYYVISSLRFIDNTKWIPKVPKYKEYPKNPDITIRKVMDCFNKKIK